MCARALTVYWSCTTTLICPTAGSWSTRRLVSYRTLVPTLTAALGALPEGIINVEVKNLPGDPDHARSAVVVDQVVEMVGPIVDRVIVTSFDMAAIDRVKAKDASIPTGWLLFEGGDSTATLDRVVAHGHQAINPHASLVDESFVRKAHERSLEVNVWTVDDLDRIDELAAMGVDAVITNAPGAVRDHLDTAR